MEVKEQITNLLNDLKKGLYEKEEVMALSLLSAIAGESIFLLGPPGVAKSMIARRLKYAFADINGSKPNAFEYLMNRFSTPDEIFGPVSISKLKDHDKYERLTDKYLPNATVVFLDEIWKAGPSIQNALLTVLNEKVYRNGEQEIKNLPIKAIISASNELPMKGEGLEALWDRFLVRYIVDGVIDKDNFNDMILKNTNSYEDNVNEIYKISNEAYYNWNENINNIVVPENVLNVIHIIRIFIQEYNNKEENKGNQIYISDRRWKKIIKLLRTSAFLNNRLQVDLMDCFLIANCIWNEPEQIQTVAGFTKDAIQKHGYKMEIDLEDLNEALIDFKNDVYSDTNKNHPTKKDLYITQKPHPSTKKHWDSEVLKFLESSAKLFSQIEKYKENDLAHLRFNIFVKSELAEIVEINIRETYKEIEKFEVDIREIKHYYDNLIDNRLLIDSNRNFKLNELNISNEILKKLGANGIVSANDFLMIDFMNFWEIDVSILEDIFSQINTKIENEF